MKAWFTKRHELSVSTYQMVILLLYNTTNELTFKEIQEATAIPEADLKRNLMALSMARFKILKPEERTKMIKPEHKFTFNAGFKSKLYRVKILQMARPQDGAERKQTREKIDEDRKHQIEAAIVRVMKARKTLEHSQLVAEVIKQLSSRFSPNPIIVKKRIESLIEREYVSLLTKLFFNWNPFPHLSFFQAGTIENWQKGLSLLGMKGEWWICNYNLLWSMR